MLDRLAGVYTVIMSDVGNTLLEKAITHITGVLDKRVVKGKNALK